MANEAEQFNAHIRGIVQQQEAQIQALKATVEQLRLQPPQQNQFSLTLDQFLSHTNKLRTFNGKDDFTVQEFINTVERNIQLCNNNLLLRAYSIGIIINDKIQGEAKKCIQRLGENGANNWDEVKRELKLHFRPRKDYSELLNEARCLKTEQFTVLWVLFTVIVLGNSAVLLTLYMNKNRKSRMNFFIKQLALADLFVGLLNVLTDIIWRITVSWRAGNTACKLIRFLQVCVTYGSTYVLVALSIDRYDAITHPMNFSGSWQRARRLVAGAWAVSAIFSAPMLFLYEEKLIQGQTQCWIDLGKPWRWQVYMSLVSASLFAFPALIISACYAIIVRTIWVKGAVFIPADRGTGCVSAASRRASSRGIIPRAKIKTVKMTFVIVIVFVVCWSPYIIFDLLQVFGQIPRTQTNIAIATFIQSLAPLNSAANPLIYCLFSTQVCRALKRVPPFRWILSMCCCKSKTRHTNPIRCTSVGHRLHNSCDSMRTLTTSLTVSRRSHNCMRPARVVIVERPKTILAMSEV